MKKGFSLIVLAVIVIIILILSTSIIIAATSTINNSKKLAFATELKMLQDSVLAYKTNNNELPTGEIIIFDLSNISQETKKQFIDNGEKIKDDKLILYEIDYDKIGVSSLKYGTGKEGHTDIYSISLETGKVYYNKGLKIGTKTYYTINDELKNILSLGWEVPEELNIVFEPDITEWTTKPVAMKVKILKKYINIDITTDKGIRITKDQNLSDLDEKYDIYVTEAQSIPANYKVTVRYNEDVNTLTLEDFYQVSNVDLNKPVAEVTTKVGTNYITLDVKASDDESGIKKYYYSKDGINFIESEDSSYTFNNLIENKEYSLSVKVEDNVGNISEFIIENKVRTASMGDILISGDFDKFVTGTVSISVNVNFNNLSNNIKRFYKIDDGDWIEVTQDDVTLLIDKECTIYAKLVDESGQEKEVKKEILKIE